MEASIFKLPHVLCYKGPALIVALARKFVKVKFLGLANLILDREITKELIQDDMTPEKIVSELRKFETEEGIKKMTEDFNDLLSKLGTEGASKLAAEAIINDIK